VTAAEAGQLVHGGTLIALVQGQNRRHRHSDNAVHPALVPKGHDITVIPQGDFTMQPSFSRRAAITLASAAFAVVPLSPPARADGLRLRMPSHPNGSHIYYSNLLTTALEAAGDRLSIEAVPGIPPNRFTVDMKEGLVDICALVRSAERDRLFVRIPVPLTDGLIGQRVLLIPPGDQPGYDHVHSLDDFRALGKVAAIGKGWADVRFWQFNQLKFYEHPRNWQSLYHMVASKNRDVDYLSRSVIEVMDEIGDHPELDIEQRLLFRYDTDIFFYISQQRAEAAPVIGDALAQAFASGMLAALARARWEGAIRVLDLPSRTVLSLADPV
jgi:hypothetical protein